MSSSMDDALQFNVQGGIDCPAAREHAVAIVGDSPWQRSQEHVVVGAHVMLPAGELAGVVTRAYDGD